MCLNFVNVLKHKHHKKVHLKIPKLRNVIKHKINKQTTEPIYAKCPL